MIKLEAKKIPAAVYNSLLHSVDIIVLYPDSGFQSLSHSTAFSKQSRVCEAKYFEKRLGLERPSSFRLQPQSNKIL